MKLTSLIRDGLDQRQFPLFVAEGTAAKKLEQIRRNAYLAYCLDKFGRVGSTLVVFGLSFGDSDAHIRQAIAENKLFNAICVGLYGNPASEPNQNIDIAVRAINGQRARLGYKILDVRYFDSAQAAPWGATDATPAR